jgi:hypothetical protein
VAFFIHFASLGANLVPFQHWGAILQTASSLGGFFFYIYIFPFFYIYIFPSFFFSFIIATPPSNEEDCPTRGCMYGGYSNSMLLLLFSLFYTNWESLH